MSGRHRTRIGYAAAGALFVAALRLFGQDSDTKSQAMDQRLEQLERVVSLANVSISPDGRWAAWTEHRREHGEGTDLYLADRTAPGAQPASISVGEANGPGHHRQITWAPDSLHFAFLSDAGSSQDQVYTVAVKDRIAHKVTSLAGYVTDPRWSPDGKRLAFLYAEGGGGGGPLEAEPAQLGEIGAAVHNQRLTTISSDGSGLHQLTQSDLNIYEFDWAPDGQRFVATAAPGPADNNWWIAKLYSVNEGGEMHVLYAPPVERQLADPRWSPDGKSIAFIGGLMSDEGFTGGDIFTLPSTGGPVRNLTPQRRLSASSLHWKSGVELLFTAHVEGGSEIATMRTKDAETEVLWKGGEGMHEAGNYPNFALAADGRTSAVVRSSWENPPEVWSGPIGSWQRLTSVNTEQKPLWGKSESISWQSGGHAVQGWLLYPTNFDPAKRYPMVVEIHGGPAGQRTSSWPGTHFDMSVMAGLGYFVFFPNPRGSYGEGEVFTRANVKDFGYGDLRDVMAGVDAVLKKVPVDATRLGVTGWSYGGFMTMWTVTQTQRFRAAVAGAGIADWLSYYGQNSIDEWMIPYFGASVYDAPAVYAKSSPITYIKRVKTPTLVVVGERDAECPAPQSFEFWHALKSLNVPTKLVVYAGEGHSFHEPKDRLDVMRRTLAWFDDRLRDGASTRAAVGH